jgi:hypothetical protein
MHHFGATASEHGRTGRDRLQILELYKVGCPMSAMLSGIVRLFKPIQPENAKGSTLFRAWPITTFAMLEQLASATPAGYGTRMR